MTQDIIIRAQGRAGRITLNRPRALNALSYDMCLAIDAALRQWCDDPDVALVIIDAAGDRAFCAGGDIQEMYDTGTQGDYAYGRRFWADEYRMNARIARFPKPYVALMQGFTMGGGVGVGCHGSHRIVGDSSQIAMPECGIGLVPDVGGSLLLARAPGNLGAYLALTAARMNADDAIHTGFADVYVPESMWSDLVAELEKTGDPDVITKYAAPPPAGTLRDAQAEIDRLFAAPTLAEIWDAVSTADSALAQKAAKAISRNSPLSMAVTLQMLHNLRDRNADIVEALTQEYRFTARSMEHGDFLEGIRAAIIDKDRNPQWRHDAPDAVDPNDAAALLAPLGDMELDLQGE